MKSCKHEAEVSRSVMVWRGCYHFITLNGVNFLIDTFEQIVYQALHITYCTMFSVKFSH